MEKKRFMIYPKSFLKAYSFYIFEVLIAIFLVVMIAFDTQQNTLIISTCIILTLYIFANIRFFKAEIEGDKVYFPKDKVKFDEKDSNFYYYRSNITDLGDELETPFFVFSKSNVKSARVLSKNEIPKDDESIFPEMFYGTKKKDMVLIEFNKSLEFQKYKVDDFMAVDESIRKVDKLYVSVIKGSEFLKDISRK